MTRTWPPVALATTVQACSLAPFTGLPAQRAHTLVGVGAALFMPIGKYSFMDVPGHRGIILDPSRAAA